MKDIETGNRFIINIRGSVSMGVINPTEKLYINKKVKAKGIIIE